MKKLVVLKLDGDFEQGFRVNLETGEEGKRPSADLNGRLPSNPAMPEFYERWRSIYRREDGPTRIKHKNGQKTNFSWTEWREDCCQAADELNERFQSWLLSDSFRPIRERCIEHFTTSSEGVRVIIRTSCPTLQRLPWHQWDLVERYDQVEIAISPPESEDKGKAQPLTDRDKVRTLAILGNSAGIDVQKDREALGQLSGVDITFLVEPERKEINDQLWEQPWDILFFAGHSETKEETGLIHINPTDSLTIGDLKYGLKKAIKQGLQLAIFNSCDGLGLAWKLQELSIPQGIVMREPVPDYVAQQFLKDFLREFAAGKSLYQAVSVARKRLQGLEDKYPCASWLPVIVQNAAAVPPTWHSLRYGNQQAISRRILRTALVASVVVTALVLGVRHFGLLQSLELQAYDQLMQLRPDEGPDDRLLAVEITEDDIQYQYEKGWETQKGATLSDAALAKLLEKLEPYQPRAIGLDIYRDFPVSADYAGLANKLRQDSKLFAVCKGSNPTEREIGVAPPPEVPEDRLGFSDVIPDSDDVLRRYLWNASFNGSSCPTQWSLSLQLASHYLEAEGIQSKPTSEDYVQVGNIHLKPWKFPAGGYQQEEDIWNLMLLNYRTRGDIAQRVTLTDVLQGKFDRSWVKDRIVLIGVTAESVRNDYFSTPFSRDSGQKMSGVFIQGQMVSQILSAVLNGRPLLSVWPLWGETVWIWSWAIVGGLLFWGCWRLKSPLQYLFLAGGMAIIVLSGLCYIFLLIPGWWVPLVPPVLVLVGTGGWVVLLTHLKNFQV